MTPDFLLLKSKATNKPKEWLLAHPEYRLSLIERFKLAWLGYRRRRGVPFAYLTGHKEFFGLDFFVNKHVLIPRPETELMVEEIVKIINNEQLTTCLAGRRVNNTTLIDVGTGSGCIPIAIATVIRKSGHASLAGRLSGNPDKIFATDISHSALRVAKRNAKMHNVKIYFLHGDLLEPIKKQLTINNKQIFITANLPYLTKAQFDSEPSIQHEPRQALVADDNGLALYKKLLKQIQAHLLIVNCSLLIFFEIDPSQSPAIILLIKKYLPKASVEIKPDLAGLDRLVKIKI